MIERVVLAHSGDQDTSVAIGWTAEEAGAEVIAVAGAGRSTADRGPRRSNGPRPVPSTRPAGHGIGDSRTAQHGGRATVTGRKPSESLYDFNPAPYGSGDTFDRSGAKGFIDVFGLPARIAAKRDLA
ncbi:hypothetical protein [Streptomyces sp. NBC_00859]|uniref:hypothetical protein n=1 Tax=Streptomyces sp. NBC_00859 TaxID=2903682 RepID=UPI00386ECFDC|nr:argininosuccinate synthase [Streptomyces sp. NBC_00859]